MTAITFVESGMRFGPYDADHYFAVEQCQAYVAIQEHVKIAEFAWLREIDPPELWIVEAKSSNPQPSPPERFREFIQEIRDKLLNALTMVFAARLGRPSSAKGQLPAEFAKLDLSSVDARFILVVNGHNREWLAPLQESLSQALRPTVKTWGFSALAVVVLNDALARQYHLIQ